MREVLALAAKDVRLLLRDKAGFIFTFFWPLMMAVFFGMMFSGQAGSRPGLAVVVVDEDASDGSRAFVEALEKGEELEVLRASARDEAASLVRLGRRTASIVLPKGFGDRANPPLGVPFTPPHVSIGFDPSRRAEAMMLQGVLIRYVMAPRLKNLPVAGESFEIVAFENMEISAARSGPPNSFAFTFAQGIIWGIIGAAAAFGVSLVSERTHGTLVRLVMSPFSPTKILAGKAIACFATTVSVSTVLILIGVVAFGVRPTSVPILGLAILCASFGFAGIMMLLAVIGRTEASASGIGWAVFLAMALFGGGMVPLFAMPSWMGSVSSASPVKWAVLALEGGLWRDFSLSEMALPCGILLAIGVAGLAIGVKCFRYADR